CPNAADTSDPESEGAKYQYPGPTMLPLDGFEGWYYWEFEDVCDNSGVTMMIDGKNIMPDGVNVKADKAFDATGAEVEWPTVDPTSISLIKGSQKGIETYKIFEDGKIYIVRDGVKYDIAGRIIK
ncbi:MAG: hypothetical protein HUJ96_04890, partial [Marinilabiliaceae bacterium]|nr:hypothetical protein [Marinilabiliaceae bacterium]